LGSIIGNHLRGNIVGYVALFLVLTGGTAYALDGSNTVFTDDIVNGQVTGPDLAGGAVTSLKIRDGQVLNEDLAPDAVTGDKVKDGSLTGSDLGDRSIGGQTIANETLTGTNVNDGSLFGADIANGSIGAADLGTHAVGATELDPAAFEPSDIAQKSASDPRYGIAPNAIQGDEVADNSLTGADINESTLDTPEAAYAKADSGVDLPDDDSNRTIASRTVEPGSYVVLAKASLSSSDGQFSTCRLHAVRAGFNGDLDSVTNPTVKPQFGLPGAWDEMSLMGLVASGAGNIQLSVICHGAGVTTSNVRLVALKVNRLVGTNAP
jgi:hypothetical protein